jgi:hypothetical protein
LNTWGVLFELFGGDYAKLSFLDKCIWIYYRVYVLNYNMGVFQRNTAFLFWKDLAAAASAAWFMVLFPWNFFLRLTADELTYDHDFDEIDAKGYDYSLTQATSYHYWEGKESHGLFNMLWTNYVVDFLQVVLFGLPLLVVGPAYFIFQFVYVLSLPLIWTIELITPWEEVTGEDPVMWWVDAIALGLYDPMNPPTNFWEIEGARTQYLSREDEDDEDEDEDQDRDAYDDPATSSVADPAADTEGILLYITKSNSNYILGKIKYSSLSLSSPSLIRNTVNS